MLEELVCHKVLDLFGDFALLGAPLLADISAHKRGHALHARCLKLPLNKKEYYLEVFYPEAEGDAADSIWRSVRPTSSPTLNAA